MKEFFVGLIVLLLLGVFSVLGALLFPLIIVLSFFLKFILGALIFILMVWIIGKVTLLAVESIKNRENKTSRPADE